MTATLGRRLARLEAARTARALADLRTAFAAWALRPDGSATREEAEARVAAMRARLSPAEQAQAERFQEALHALLDPTTPPAGIARAAAALATEGAYGLVPGDPPHVVLGALVARYRSADD